MADQPPAILPPLTPEPPTNGHALFTSPYGMFPDVDAARDALAARAAEKGNVIEPLAAVFDPTKPTIDQTRANAIHAIQQNFEALIPVSVPVDHSVYLKKTNDTAANLYVNPGALVMDGGAGGWSMISWRQAGVQRWDTFCDSGGFYVTAYLDGGGSYNLLVLGRQARVATIYGRLGVGGAPRDMGGAAAIGLDVQTPGLVTALINDTSSGASFRIQATSGGTYLDGISSRGDNGAMWVTPGIPLMVRTQDAAGALQTRLRFDPSGAIMTNSSAFVGGFLWYGGPAAFTPDFRIAQTIGIQPGSSITTVVLVTGQVARIYVNGPGAVPYPASWHIQQGGAVWGLAFTVINLWTHDGTNIFATFTPYDT